MRKGTPLCPELKLRLRGVRALILDVDGTLTDGTVYVGPTGEALRQFDMRDGMGTSLLIRSGFQVAMITSEESEITASRAQKLRITDVFFGVKDKVHCIVNYLASKRVDWGNIVYMGDDINDLPVFNLAGFSACPADAHFRALDAVDYVCAKPGGHGAVREVCDLILHECGAELDWTDELMRPHHPRPSTN